MIYDDNGVKKEMKTQDIWGYGRNGVLYINVGSNFPPDQFGGQYSPFRGYQSPPIIQTITIHITTTIPTTTIPIIITDTNAPAPIYSSTELKQYLLDFETGEVLEYDTESVEVLLMKDPELADEYLALRSRKKKQMKFVFIRRYNEKHPLYFPAN